MRTFAAAILLVVFGIAPASAQSLRVLLIPVETAAERSIHLLSLGAVP
jgi:hypothetical protein